MITLSLWCRSLVQQPPVQVSRPRPPYPDLTRAGLAHQPDETAHPLPFTTRTEWVDKADLTCCILLYYHFYFNLVGLSQYCSWPQVMVIVSSVFPQHSMRNSKWSWRRDEPVRSDLLTRSGLLSQHTQSSVPNPFSPQLCIHPVPSRWMTKDYKIPPLSHREIQNAPSFILLVLVRGCWT